MGSDTEELLRSIDKNLKSLLRVKVAETLEEDATNKEKVKVLSQFGFDNAEIAEIIDTTAGSVRATKSDLRSDGEIE